MQENTNIHPNLLDEREGVTLDDFLKELDWESVDLTGNWFDPTEEDIPRRFTLSWKGVKFAPIGGVHGLTGQPGHGKTFTFTQLMVAILRGDYQGLHCELDDPNTSVLYIDTEMEKVNTQLVVRRVYDMMGWEQRTVQDRFKVLWLREEVKAEDRWRKTLKAIWEMKPTVVFLDGLIDVIGDFNDNKECQKIIYQCMAVASHYSISMWCLLHLNPGSEKMVGHAGSFLERKATDVLRTKKDKEAGSVHFIVSQAKARARDLDDWKFTIEDDEHHYGHPVIEAVNMVESVRANEDKKQAEQVAFDNEVRTTFINIFHGNAAVAMSYGEMEAYMNLSGITSKRKQDKLRKRAEEIGILRKEPLNGKYYLQDQTPNELPQEPDPF